MKVFLKDVFYTILFIILFGMLGYLFLRGEHREENAYRVHMANFMERERGDYEK